MTKGRYPSCSPQDYKRIIIQAVYEMEATKSSLKRYLVEDLGILNKDTFSKYLSLCLKDNLIKRRKTERILRGKLRLKKIEEEELLRLSEERAKLGDNFPSELEKKLESLEEKLTKPIQYQEIQIYTICTENKKVRENLSKNSKEWGYEPLAYWVAKRRGMSKEDAQQEADRIVEKRMRFHKERNEENNCQ